MHLVTLTIADFRNISEIALEPDPDGTTLITGANGAGKSSVLEAIGYLSTLQSFRGAPRDALVRRGAEQAIIRCETRVGDRSLVIEAELSTLGRSRAQVNRQAVRRRDDLHDALRTTVFSPEDVGVVRSGPAERRRFLDDALAVMDPKAARIAEDVERVLRQRTALLRNAGRRLTPEVASTLDVWDSRLAESGTALVEARESMVDQIAPLARAHYSRLSGVKTPVGLEYRRSWSGALAAALEQARAEDVSRGVSTVGPHRDELELTLRGMPARTHASQGEQRSLALALRLAGHQLATERLGSPPVLLLDDVFSELDQSRSRALLAGLPPGQAIVTTALPPPPEVSVAKAYSLVAGGRAVVETVA